MPVSGENKINTRFLVLKALLRVETQRSYSNMVLNSVFNFNKSVLDARDKSFVSKLFYGTLEKSITLAYIISQYSKLKLTKLSQEILIILKMAFYQLLYMDKTPESAIVNESVNLTKIVKQKSAATFVNAVLRNFLRNAKSYKLPDNGLDHVKYLSVKYSCSEDIIKTWEKDYGPTTTIDMLAALDQEAYTYIRVNNTQISKKELKDRLIHEGMIVEDVENLASTLKISKINSIEDNESYKLGLFHIQNISSQLYCELIKPKSGDIIYDVCAAPGGKTFTISEILENKGKIYAFDIYEHKIAQMKANAARLGLNNIVFGKRDARNNVPPIKNMADKVICDLPCSGLGTLRSKPEIRGRNLKALDNLVELQYIILSKSAELLKNNGLLFYSTCTLNEKENNELVNKFLKTHKQFSIFDLKPPIAWIKELSIMLNKSNKSVTIPISKTAEGFFFAAFKRIY